MGTGKRGRPAGLLVNPEALEHLLGERTQSWLAVTARVSVSQLSELAVGARGVTPATATRLAEALRCKPGVIFPELANFKTTLRVFEANGVTP